MARVNMVLRIAMALIFSETMGSDLCAQEVPEGMVLIPEGTFEMGREGYVGTEPMHDVTLDAFYMDVNEVTIAQYVEFLNSGGNDDHYVSYMANPSVCGIGKLGDGDYTVAPWRENYPVVYITWGDAKAYCEWAGKRLPTEAEWEYAARGTDGRTYPWGEWIDPMKANYGGNVGHTTEVGSYPDGVSPFGCYDMCGNVWEWVWDWYGDYPSGAVSNPTGPATGIYRIIRGGSWNNDGGYSHATDRSGVHSSAGGDGTGIRCVRGVEPDISISPVPIDNKISIDFGSVPVGASKRDTVMIRNGDCLPGLTVQNWGPHAKEFEAVPSLMTVPFKQTGIIELTFTPSDTISFADTVSTVITNVSGWSTWIILDGRSTPAVIQVVPRTSIAFFLYKSDADWGLPVAPGIVVVAVGVKQVTDLRSFSFTLSYDPSLLAAQSHIIGGFFGSTGRTVEALKDSIDNVAGKAVLEYTTTGEGSGPDSSGTLATILFHTRGVGMCDVSMDSIRVFTGSGEETTSIQEGSIIIWYTYFADLDNDQDIDVLDIQQVAGRYYTYPSIDDPMSFRADIDGSGKVRINDVQSVAGRFGMSVPSPPGSDKPVVSSVSRPAEQGKGKLVLRWDGEDRQMSEGDRFRVDLIADACEELGAFQFDLVFDPAQVEIEEVTPGNLWNASENKICSAGPYRDLAKGRMKYGVYSLGTRPGMDGSGVIVTVEMVSKVEGVIHLDVERVEAGDMLGVPLWVTMVGESVPTVVECADVPDRFTLSQNYPNPFNPETTISYDAARTSTVRLSVYSLSGQLIRALVDEEHPAGTYSVTWDGKDDLGRDVASGVYLCRMEAGDHGAMRKMLLIR